MSLAAMAATAAIPVAESPMKAQAPGFGVQKNASLAEAARENTFFEDFEQRPGGFGNYADDWLPEGWTKFSKAGHTIPTDNTRHNLLWRVTDNDNKNVALVIPFDAYEGNCFAHIIADVAYETGDGFHTPDFQDEWLVTPAFTPQTEDWLYFKLNYYPYWTVYNREADDFSGKNNDLEIYVSVNDGQDWTKLWDLIEDEVRVKYTDEDLRNSLVLYPEYVPIYVNLKDYVGSSVKLAFRFYGNLGQGVAIDNVAVGVPMPVANYTLPGGVFLQQLSPKVDYPANPTMLVPYGQEILWRNTSTDILRNEWTYEDAAGARQQSTDYNLTTPAYDFNTTHMTPELQGFFESRESELFHTNYPVMQAGGILIGADKESGYNGQFSVGRTDVLDGDIRYSSELTSLFPDIDLAWEKIQGVMDGTLDVYGFCSVYPKPAVAYGFDYVDLTALVLESVPEDDGIEVMVFALDEETAMPDHKIGQGVLWGKDIPAAADEFVNLRVNFDVPVYVEKDIMILVMGCRKGGHVALANMITKHPEKYGNNLIYWLHYDNNVEGGYYEEFKNLGTLPGYTGGRHFAGLLIGMGAAYSTMERLDNEDFVVPVEGGSKEFKIKSTQAPDTWKLTEDGVTLAEWAHFTTTYDEASQTYTLTLTADANDGDARDGDLTLVCPGSYVKIHTVQAAGINGAFADNAVSVKVSNGDIVVEGGKEVARVYDVAGKLVAEAILDGRTVISGDNLDKGVYIVRVDDAVSFKVVK